jgi:hypothetical protein
MNIRGHWEEKVPVGVLEYWSDGNENPVRYRVVNK